MHVDQRGNNKSEGTMKIHTVLLTAVIMMVLASSLQAGEIILYGGTQKPGKLKFSSVSEVPDPLLDGDWGGTFGARFTGQSVFSFEPNISYSPRFAKKGIKAFQMDGNLVLQAPGNIVPYATAGIGFIVTWGEDIVENSIPEEIAAAALKFGPDFTVNYGGGLKLRRIAGPLGLNVDLRGYTVPAALEESFNFIQISFGAVISW
jgi:hypothetical protein